MTQDISSLMDGELDGHEAERAIRTCCDSEQLKDTWHLYHVIGDAIRGQAPRHVARPSIAEALRREPSVLAPRRGVLETAMGRVALAAAASVATIGVVGWIGTQGGPSGSVSSTVAARGVPASPMKPLNASTTAPVAAPAAPAAQAAPAAVPSIDQEYLLAHRQIPSPDLYRRAAANRAAAGAR